LLLNFARKDPALFLQRFTAPMLIDKIQYAAQLLPYIKMSADADRKPGSFWLTGSQQFQLMRNVSESLAGRVAVLQLLGLSRRESVGDGEAQKPFLPKTSIFRDAHGRPMRFPSRICIVRAGKARSLP
jgi:predicted AAA+ superfamily ATPase